MPRDHEEFERAIGNLSRSAIGGVLVGLPVLLFVALDAATWLSFGHLVVVILVLTGYVIRQRRGSRADGP